MNSRPPPRYVVQSLGAASLQRRRWLWLGAAWLGSLLLVAVVVWLLADRMPQIISRSPSSVPELKADNDQLRQQVATLTRSAQVAQVAGDDLKKTLSDRDEQINGLRTDLAFYSHLVGGGAQREGLRVQDVHLKPMSTAHAWNFTITLTQNSKNAKPTSGTLAMAVDGILKGHLTRVGWDKIGNTAQKDGIPFSFKYFQQLHDSLMLPAGFTPNRLHVSVTAKGDKPIVSDIAGTTHRHVLSRCYSRRNANRDLFFLTDAAFPATLAAGRLHDASLALAGGARRDGDERSSDDPFQAVPGSVPPSSWRAAVRHCRPRPTTRPRLAMQSSSLMATTTTAATATSAFLSRSACV